MIAPANQNQLSDQEYTFYEENICAEADLVFRFCLSLTLNADASKSMLVEIFRKASQNVKALKRLEVTSLRSVLFKYALETAKKSSGDKREGSSPAIAFLKGLPNEDRSIFVAVDIAGLSIAEAADVFGKDENLIRQHVAEARARLVHDVQI